MKGTLLERLLEYYDIDNDTYLELTKEVTIDNFAAGHSFKDMDKAVAIVKEAIANKDKIFIYGDYDADGIMSTSIVVKSLLMLGVIPSFYIPNRYNDGYGITLEKAKEIVDDGVKLVITVDNGVSANEPIAYLREHGLTVVVLDHHVVPDVIPNADVIIHPTYSGFGETASSAGFVSFMFSWALLGRFDKYLSCLAAISVISDMMPLKDCNRHFLRLVFSSYVDNEFYSIDLLKEGMTFDETSIGMKIAPKINALGRLLDDKTINYVVHYFVTTDKNKIDKLYKWINDKNEERKVIGKEAEESLSDFVSDKKAIVLYKDVPEGLLGILSNHLCSKEHKPTIVFTDERGGEMLKGSCRAPEGFNVIDAFNYCNDLLVTAGGHALAGGCSIYKKDLQTFENKFVEFAEKTPITKVEHQKIEIGLTEINEENYDLIRSFSPFGEGWKLPVLLIKRIKTSSLTFSRTGEHLLSYIGNNVRLTGFGISKESLNDYAFIDVIGHLKKSTYRGNTSLEFIIKEAQEN